MSDHRCRSAWVCPCCLAHVAEVLVREVGDWQMAVDGITKHLLLRCPAFSPERLETKPEPLVQEAASQEARCPQAPSHTPTGATKPATPSPRLPSAGARGMRPR